MKRLWSPTQEISAGVTRGIESPFVECWLARDSWSGIPTQLLSPTSLSQDMSPATDEGTPNNDHVFAVTINNDFILPHLFLGQRQHM